jgi:ferredoxin
MPRIDTARCNGSGECIAHCPTDALGWQNGKAALTAPEKCIYCAVCESICPASAIELPYLVVKGTDTFDSGEHDGQTN